jgi:hypothetical protein
MKTPSSRLLIGVAGVLLFTHIVFYSITAIADPDAWGHALLGRILIEKGRIPCFSDYSWMPGDTTPRPFVCGIQVLLYLVLHHLGYPGLLLLRFVLLILICYFLWRTMQLHAIPWPLFVFSSMCFFVVGYPRFLPRGDFFNLLFFIVYLYSLERFLLHHGKWIWYLPVLQVIWSNIHQLSPFGVALIGLYVIYCYAHKNWPIGHRLALLTTACSLALFATPAGYSQLVQTWQFALNNPVGQEITRGVAEFVPLVELYNPFLIFSFWFCLLFTLLLVICNRQWQDFHHLSLFLLLAWASWQHVRVIGFFALHVAYFLPKQMRLWTQRHVPAPASYPRFLALGYTGVILLQAALTISLLIGYLGSWNKMNDGNGVFSDSSLPQSEAVQFLQKFHFTGNVYTDYNVGSYVSYHLYPSARTFMHSLCLYYSLENYRLYSSIAETKINPTGLILSYNIELFVLEHTCRDNYKLIRWLSQATDWLLVCANEGIVVFAARESNFVRQNSLVEVSVATLCQRSGIADSPSNLALVSSLMLDIGHDEEAKITAQQALRLDPHQAIALNNLGVLAWQESNWELALQRFSESAEQNRRNISPRKNIVRLFAEKIVFQPDNPLHRRARDLGLVEK